MSDKIAMIRKYDKVIVAVMTVLGLCVTAYITIGSRLDAIVSGTKTVVEIKAEIQNSKTFQKERNDRVEAGLRDLKESVDKLVQLHMRP